MTQAATQKGIVGNISAIGFSGLIFVASAGFFGRTPVTVIFQAAYFASSVWSAEAKTFPSYLASRIVSGLTSSSGQGGALLWVKDMVCSCFARRLSLLLND